MVWGCFSSRGRSELVFVTGNFDSSRYCTLLGTTLLPFLETYHPEGAIYQQENAPAHTSAYTRDYFFDMDINVMEWPSRSPDQNPIENLWAVLSRAIYRNGRQFDTLDDLKEALQLAWDNIEPATLKKLVKSMPRRIVSLIEVRGAAASY